MEILTIIISYLQNVLKLVNQGVNSYSVIFKYITMVKKLIFSLVTSSKESIITFKCIHLQD